MDEKFVKLFDLAKKSNPNRVWEGDDLSMGSVAPYGVSSGLAELDLFLGRTGGFPAGKVIEIYGKEASGKTSLALHAAAEWQKRGGLVVFIDTEKAYTPRRARQLGCKPENIIKQEADTIEQAFEFIKHMLDNLEASKAEHPVLFIVDSVTGVPTNADISGNLDDSERPGFEAKQIKRALKQINPRLGDLPSKPSIIFINHAISKFVPFGKQTDSGGGLGIKYYAFVRLEATKTKQLKEAGNNERRVGQEVQISIEKLKGGELEFPKFKLNLLNDTGFDRFESLKGAMVASGMADKPKGAKAITILSGTPEEASIKTSDFELWVNQNGGYDKQYSKWREWAIVNNVLNPWGAKWKGSTSQDVEEPVEEREG